jgi:hypothetical protein
MQNDTLTTWTIVSSLAALAAVVVALGLSVLPALYRKCSARRRAREEVKRAFLTINTYLEHYRYYYVTHMFVGKVVCRQFEPKKLPGDIQVNPANLLNGLQAEIKLLGKTELIELYDLSLEVFSGWPVLLSKWYELEARICLRYHLKTEGKKYFREAIDSFDPDDPPENFRRTYHCIVCADDRPYDGLLVPENNDPVSVVFKTRRCPRHGIPMHVSFRSEG